jgi:hypothetical protein
LKFCNKGARAFFLRHNLDWSLFMQQGIEAAKLEEIGDAMAIAAIEQAKKRTTRVLK